MEKKVAVVTVAEAEEVARVADLPVEAKVALAEVAGAIKDGLMAFASATGLVVMHQMMEAELESRIGLKHARIPAAERMGNWHGSTEGPVVLGGRTVTTKRPRGRSTDRPRVQSCMGAKLLALRGGSIRMGESLKDREQMASESSVHE